MSGVSGIAASRRPCARASIFLFRHHARHGTDLTVQPARLRLCPRQPASERTRSLSGRVASNLRASGAVNSSVAPGGSPRTLSCSSCPAIAYWENGSPIYFRQDVPAPRLPPPAGGAISSAIASIERRVPLTGLARRCSTAAPGCPAALRIPKWVGHDSYTTLLLRPSITVIRSRSARRRQALRRAHSCHSISYVRKGSFGYQQPGRSLAGLWSFPDRTARRRIPLQPMTRWSAANRMPVVFLSGPPLTPCESGLRAWRGPLATPYSQCRPLPPELGGANGELPQAAPMGLAATSAVDESGPFCRATPLGRGGRWARITKAPMVTARNRAARWKPHCGWMRTRLNRSISMTAAPRPRQVARLHFLRCFRRAPRHPAHIGARSAQAGRRLLAEDRPRRHRQSLITSVVWHDTSRISSDVPRCAVVSPRRPVQASPRQCAI